MNDSTYLENVHKVLKEILDYVCRVCEENNLCYFLGYGTALGAKRHSGFIPWDDDIDILMPREDCNALMQLLEKDNSEYSLQYVHNEKKYFLLFPKVRKNNSLFRESIVDGVYENNGFFIDIFPIDFVDDKNLKKVPVIVKKVRFFTHSLRFITCNKHYRETMTKGRYLLDYVITFPFRLMNREKLISRIVDRLSSYGSYQTSRFIIEYSDQLCLVDKSVFFPPSKMEFEGTMYNVPGKIDEYLAIEYGPDYMQLPPADQRVTHAPLEVIFDMGDQQ